MSLNQLRTALSAQWKLPKQKNAKPGGLYRDYSVIKQLHADINALKRG